MTITVGDGDTALTISSDEAAGVLRCTVNTLHALLAQGVFPAIKPGKEWVIPRAAFVAAINAVATRQVAERAVANRPPIPASEPRRRGPKPRAGWGVNDR